MASIHFTRLTLLSYVLYSCWLIFVSAKDVSYMESNIGHFSSGERYVDLVSAVTQASVSHTMNEFIASLDTTPQTFAYKLDNQSYVYVSEDDAYAELGFNLLDIPDGVCSNVSENLKKAVDLGYRYGVRLAYGYPEGVDQSLIPTPIVFDQKGYIVTYNMVMSKFDLMHIAADPVSFKPCSTVYSQDTYLAENPGSMPYYFQWQVKLDLNSDDLNPDLIDKLPDKAVDEINNVGPSMFSVDQLFLDLNSALLIYASINIPGLSQDDPLFFFLTSFLETFVRTVDPDGNGVLLGFSVNEDDYVDYQTLFVPTEMNFQISLHLDSNGNPSGQNDLNTLNYWLSGNGHKLTSPQVFPFNWIERPDLESGFDGVMSLSREMISTKMNEALRDELASKICYTVDASMTMCTHGYCMDIYGWCYGFRHDLTPCDSADYELENGDNGLVLSYHKVDEDHSTCDYYYPDFWAQFKMRFESWSKVYFTGNQIKIENEVMVDESDSCEYGSAGTNGTVAHFLSTTIYDVKISDDAGEIEVNFVSTDSQDLSDDIDIELGTCTAKSITDTQASILAQMDDLQHSFNSYADHLKEILNGHQYFLFPGGNTYSFEDTVFSHYGDLLSHIKYRST